MRFGHRQPGLAGREAGVRRLARPGHRGAATVAALELGPEGDAVRVLQQFEGHVRFRQGQLVTLVQAGGALERELHRQHQLGQCRARALARRTAPAGDDADGVVVADRPGGPAVLDALLEVLDLLADVACREFRGEQVEAVGHVQLVAAFGVLGHLGQRVVRADLADRDRAEFVQLGAHALQEGDVLRLGLVVNMGLHAVGVHVGDGRGVAHQGRRVAAQLAVVEVEHAGVHAHAVHPVFEPEALRVQVGLLHVRVVEVQLRLADQEVVHVVLLAAGIPLPGRAAEHRHPVVGRAAVRQRIGPHVPVGLRIVAALAALDEPGVGVGGMRHHLVDHDLQAQAVRLGDQLVEVGQVAEQRVDVAVVGDVVAEVLHRRGEEGRQPDDVHAQARDVVELVGDAGQVAHAIAIGVEVAARIDLVDDGFFPPVRVGGRRDLGHGWLVRSDRNSRQYTG